MPWVWERGVCWPQQVEGEQVVRNASRGLADLEVGQTQGERIPGEPREAGVCVRVIPGLRTVGSKELDWAHPEGHCIHSQQAGPVLGV